MTSFYSLKSYKRKAGGGYLKSPNLGVRTLWTVPPLAYRLIFICSIAQVILEDVVPLEQTKDK